MEYILLCCIYVGWLFYNWRVSNDLLAPHQVFGWYWFLQILIIVPACGFTMWKYDGLLYIFLCVVAFSTGFLFLHSKVRKPEVHFYRHISVSLLRGIIFFTGLGIIAHIFSIFELYELSIQDGVFHISTISDKLYSLRTHGGEKSSFLSKASLILLYAYPLLTGYYYRELKNKLFTIVGLLLILYVSLLLGTKALFITSVLLWISGWLVSTAERGSEYKIKWVNILVSVIGIFIILFISTYIRNYGISGNTIVNALGYTRNLFFYYTFAHLLAFDNWFFDYVWEIFTWGQYTFFGIFNTLGLAHREVGIFREVSYIGLLRTNVYTVFRSIITDFSPFGGWVFMAVWGLIASIAYKKVRFSVEASPLAVTICVVVYAFILWSFVTSIFAYASYICAFVYFYLCQKVIIWSSR